MEESLWYIVWAPDSRSPITLSGRLIATIGQWPTREGCQEYINKVMVTPSNFVPVQ